MIPPHSGTCARMIRNSLVNTYLRRNKHHLEYNFRIGAPKAPLLHYFPIISLCISHNIPFGPIRKHPPKNSKPLRGNQMLALYPRFSLIASLPDYTFPPHFFKQMTRIMNGSLVRRGYHWMVNKVSCKASQQLVVSYASLHQHGRCNYCSSAAVLLPGRLVERTALRGTAVKTSTAIGWRSLSSFTKHG